MEGRRVECRLEGLGIRTKRPQSRMQCHDGSEHSPTGHKGIEFRCREKRLTELPAFRPAEYSDYFISSILLYIVIHKCQPPWHLESHRQPKSAAEIAPAAQAMKQIDALDYLDNDVSGVELLSVKGPAHSFLRSLLLLKHSQLSKACTIKMSMSKRAAKKPEA